MRIFVAIDLPSKIKDEWLENIRFKTISFSQEHINIKTLEELLG